MRSLYVEGDSRLHRLSPRIKLILLIVVSLALFLTRSPIMLGGAAFAGALLYGSLGMGWREGWLRLRPILLTIAVVALATLMLNTVEEGVVVLLRLTTLMLVAAAVTATTPVGSFIGEISSAARPFERIGLVRADDIGLAVGLVIRFVPEVVSRYEILRQAHRARGLKLRPMTVIVPLTIQTLKSADEIAAAIDARGIRGHKPPSRS
ncbi:energy-coupling factor transporter transmembrane protein EcfT [Pseudorhizobium endolithicum]|uniref:Energy-coupling factor transporter transmembrane protein EcfT n=1 Tax=Pseudorhizobium endolithicum TaxID=1191678 RepID=A0ABM8PWS7_9HYPH|nr:energy-coupling factor transporter transmembrane protein EcfT [Pseudorhizobium endolithicum]CAD7052827.1 energy-coupling factor transporter transmembrane protein EcfT [Pseudorhizobium endolithicum]